MLWATHFNLLHTIPRTAMSCNALSGRVVKFTLKDDTRRVKLDLLADAESSDAFEGLQGAVLAAFGMASSEGECVSLKYRDEDGDLCTLTSGSMDDFATFAPVGVLRLFMFLNMATNQPAFVNTPIWELVG